MRSTLPNLLNKTMPTTKRRLNVTLPPKLEKAIIWLADEESVPQATKLIQLAQQGLELEEDYILSEIGEKRRKETKEWISHEKFWGKAV